MFSTVEARGEIRLKGLAVSRGIAIGKIVWLYGSNRQFFRIQLSEKGIADEIARFQAARDNASAQLNRLISSKASKVANSSASILASHAAILADPVLSADIESEITSRRINTEWAVKLVTDRFVAAQRSNSDRHIRERYSDVEDVAERILSALGGDKSPPKLEPDSIIAATELRPSTLVELAESSPAGIITGHGGWTSHTFILAREMNIAAVTGLPKAIRRFSNGDLAIVDGFNGQVIINPTPATLDDYRRAERESAPTPDSQPVEERASPETLDGHRIYIRANSDLPSVYRNARSLGAEGIGLYRTEFLFNKYNGFPTERQQYEAYRDLAISAGDDGARIRLFDVGIGQIIDQGLEREKNPALGLRAIRLDLAFKPELQTQLRAILRASFHGRLDIVIPMVSGVSEIAAVREILEFEKQALAKRKIRFGTPRIGAMIEVPAAVFLIRRLIREVDFVCLGTNDLIQYLLAVDRDNESVADWFQTLHPAVISAVKDVLDAAREAGKPAIVCGEMAGSPYYIPILLGLGALEFSMNANSIGNARKLINGLALEETQNLVGEISECSTAEEVESLLIGAIRQKWLHLFPRGFFASDFSS